MIKKRNFRDLTAISCVNCKYRDYTRYVHCQKFEYYEDLLYQIDQDHRDRFHLEPRQYYTDYEESIFQIYLKLSSIKESWLCRDFSIKDSPNAILHCQFFEPNQIYCREISNMLLPEIRRHIVNKDYYLEVAFDNQIML